MFEKIVEKIVNKQIENDLIVEADRSIYIYGYQILFEFGINIVTSILIAIIFQAYEIVVVFTIAFLVIRGYVGGYHAKTSLGCFCFSATMLIISVVAVKISAKFLWCNYLFLSEIILLPCIFKATPIPNKNKPITENERIYFNKKVKQIYVIELLVEVFLLFIKRNTFALSILAVHIVLFIMVLMEVVQKMQLSRRNEFEN